MPKAPKPPYIPGSSKINKQLAAAKAVKPKPAPKPAAPSLSAPLPIIVAPIPDSYVRPPLPASSSATPPDDLTAALLRDPPIVLHEGKLILNPTIFAHLTKEQLDNLQILPASQALQILQSFVVAHFKAKMRKTQANKAAMARAALIRQGQPEGLAGASGTVESTPEAVSRSGTPTLAAPTAPSGLKRKAEDGPDQPGPVPVTNGSSTATFPSIQVDSSQAVGDPAPQDPDGPQAKAAKLSASSSTPRSIPSASQPA